jgi:coenzyme F420 hydrogenase subunit beta
MPRWPTGKTLLGTAWPAAVSQGISGAMKSCGAAQGRFWIVDMSFGELEKTVLANSYCCGCGVCAAVCPANNLSMQENRYGEVLPKHSGKCGKNCGLCQMVCPFADGNRDEHELGRLLFGERSGFLRHETLGWLHETFAGRVADPDQRMQAASGGLTTAVLLALMDRGEIDAAVVAQPLPVRPWFHTRIADTPEQILASRGSVYHVTDLAAPLRQVIYGPERRYAAVSLPCAVKAIRLAQQRIPSLEKRLRYVFGLTCGGQRNRCFADLLTALAGSSRGIVSYRSKRGARRANDYRFCIAKDREKFQVKFSGLYGYLMMNGIAELKACLFCGDIFAELADAAFMDAWLPDFLPDPGGRNLVISRNREIGRVLRGLSREKECELQPVAPSQIEASQAGVIEKKRSGLPARRRAAGGTGWVQNQRPGRSQAVSSEGLQVASSQLEAWKTLRGMIAREAGRIRGGRFIPARIRAWLSCWRLYRCLRSSRTEIFNGRAVFFLQGFRPRAVLRRLAGNILSLKPRRTGGGYAPGDAKLRDRGRVTPLF